MKNLFISAILIILMANLISYLIDSTILNNIISFISISATLLGLYLTYKQSKSAAEISIETQKAVEENKTEIKRLISLSDMSHLVEKIKNAQNYILSTDYQSAVILLKDVKDEMTRAHQDYKEALKKQNTDLAPIIQDLSIDIGSLAARIISIKKGNGEVDTLQPQKIHEHLESARDIIIRIESIIKI